MESAKIASNWWAEKIQKPTIYDNGDRSKIGDMSTLFAFLLASNNRTGLSEESVELFKKTLENLIVTEIELFGSALVMVDYHPEGILREAASTAQINDSLFPWKTMMNVTEEEVKVSEGYGQRAVTIYPAKQKKKVIE